MKRVLLRVGISLCALLVVPAGEAVACSICLAGDPVFSSQGTTAQAVGSVSAYLEYRAWKKRSGLLPGEAGGPVDPSQQFEENNSQRVDLYLSWTPIDRLTLTGDVPVAMNRITEVNGDEQDHSEIDGLGDLALQVSGVLWRNRPVLPSTWIEGRGFLKLPTGRSRVSLHGVRDPHLQPGTGSVDYGFGLAAIHRLEWGSAYTSVLYRVNTPGSLDYEYGDVFLANAGLELSLLHLIGLRYFTPGFELNFRYAGSDRFEHQTYRDSGGSVLYLTPSLRIELPWPSGWRAPSIRGAAQLPVTSDWLHGFQKEYPVFSVGLQYGF